MSHLFVLFGISLILNMSLFVLAYLKQTDTLTDASYSVSFLVVLIVALFGSQPVTLHMIIISLAVSLWAMRLMVYLVVRIHAMGRDRRFDTIRHSFFGFGSFWFLQAVSVWIILLPVTQYLRSPKPIPTTIFVFGLTVWAIGLVIETLADWQKFSHKSKKTSSPTWISSGLWKYSRHPNYLGEILVWWGLFITVLPTFQGSSLLTIVGPIYITYILVCVTGIPPLEKRHDTAYAGDADYLEYKKRTPVLIPRMPFVRQLHDS